MNDINANKKRQQSNNEENKENKDNFENDGKINPIQVMKLCSDIFKEDELNSILFFEDKSLTDIGEYLEMILLFIPERDINQIIKVIKIKLEEDNKKDILEAFENIIRKINLKTKIGFQFLRKILIEFVNNKKDVINNIKIIENNFIMKNEQLRCIQCFLLSAFSILDDKINITYKCGHISSI